MITDKDVALQFIDRLREISHGKHLGLWAAYCELSNLTDFKNIPYEQQLIALGKLIREVANVPAN